MGVQLGSKLVFTVSGIWGWSFSSTTRTWKPMSKTTPHEDDDKPPAQAGVPGVSESVAPAAARSSPSAVEVPLDEHGVKRHEHADEIDQTKRARFAGDALSILEAGFRLDDSAVGEHAAKTPRLDDEKYKKKLNQVTSTDLTLYEHEDMPVSFSFSNDELDELEEYELNFDCNEWYDDEDLDDDTTIQQLMYPFSKHERNLTLEQLQRLDALAD